MLLNQKRLIIFLVSLSKKTFW